MAPKRNNMIPNGHFHKLWQRYIKTHFDQPKQKIRRRKLRIIKARKVAPKPAKGPLRAVVRCPTVRYNRKQRLGRGFTPDELRAVGLKAPFARTIGIAVDHRRRNKSHEGYQQNIQRLKEYRSKLILFPKNPKRPLKGEAKPEETSKARQIRGKVMPIRALRRQALKRHEKPRVITEEEKKFEAFVTLRKARRQAHTFGMRMKRQKEKADDLTKPAAAAPKPKKK